MAYRATRATRYSSDCYNSRYYYYEVCGTEERVLLPGKPASKAPSNLYALDEWIAPQVCVGAYVTCAKEHTHRVHRNIHAVCARAYVTCT
eukprot:2822583-Rhodomonas_salina.2